MINVAGRTIIKANLYELWRKPINVASILPFANMPHGFGRTKRRIVIDIMRRPIYAMGKLGLGGGGGGGVCVCGLLLT